MNRFWHVMVSELTKIRTLRSTRWALLIAVLACACLGYLVSFSLRVSFHDLPAQQQRDFDPLFATFYSLTIGQLAIVVFGVITIGGEFSTRAISQSLTVVPRRSRFYAAKVTAALLVTFAVAAIAVAVTFAAAQLALGPHRTTPGAPGTVQAALGGCLYLMLICALAIGVAAALRSSARALAILLPLLFLNSQGLGNVPVIGKVLDYLPDQAGAVIIHLTGETGTRFGRPYGPWPGMAIMAGWAVAALLLGYLVLVRADISGTARPRLRQA